jgi:transposase
VAHAVREFGVELDELHNDSTTVTFHGDYEAAERERTLRGRLRLAVTWGHNKDHRPDLKQLLYILTVTREAPCRCSSGSRAATPPTTARTRAPGSCPAS